MAGSSSLGGVDEGRRSLFAVETGSALATVREMAGTFWSIAVTAVIVGETFGPGPIATTSSPNAHQIATLTIVMGPARRKSGCMHYSKSCLPASRFKAIRERLVHFFVYVSVASRLNSVSIPCLRHRLKQDEIAARQSGLLKQHLPRGAKTVAD